jgi:hypothetical protein
MEGDVRYPGYMVEVVVGVLPDGSDEVHIIEDQRWPDVGTSAVHVDQLSDLLEAIHVLEDDFPLAHGSTAAARTPDVKKDEDLVAAAVAMSFTVPPHRAAEMDASDERRATISSLLAWKCTGTQCGSSCINRLVGSPEGCVMHHAHNVCEGALGHIASLATTNLAPHNLPIPSPNPEPFHCLFGCAFLSPSCAIRQSAIRHHEEVLFREPSEERKSAIVVEGFQQYHQYICRNALVNITGCSKTKLYSVLHSHLEVRAFPASTSPLCPCVV